MPPRKFNKLFFKTGQFLQNGPGVYILENTPPPGGGEKIWSQGQRGEKIWKQQRERQKRERKEGYKTVISHKITDWGKYIIFFSPQLGQRKKNILFFLQVRTREERENNVKAKGEKISLFYPIFPYFFPDWYQNMKKCTRGKKIFLRSTRVEEVGNNMANGEKISSYHPNLFIFFPQIISKCEKIWGNSYFPPVEHFGRGSGKQHRKVEKI